MQAGRGRGARGRAVRGPAAAPKAPATPDIDPATAAAEEDEEAWLPEVAEEPAGAIAEGPLAIGPAAIENAVRLPPTSARVYPLLNPANHALYVGKAQKRRKRPTALPPL